MRKWGIVLSLLLGVFLLGTSVNAGELIKIVIDGKEISTDSPAFISNDRVMVPIGVISKELGADVKWDAATRTVSVTKPKNEQKYLKLNGEQTTWPYWYEDGRIYLEYRNSVELLREANSSAFHSIQFFPDDGSFVFNDKRIVLSLRQQGDYKIASINYLRDLGFINYEFDPDTGNLEIIKK